VSSSTVFGNTTLTSFDVLVIGSGAGGGAAAYTLTKHGLKVLVIEAGVNYFDGLDDPTRLPTTRFSNDELKFAYRNFITPDPTVEPRTWRTSVSDGDRTYVGDVQGLPKTVGGGGVHADLKMPRLMPQDFTLGTTIGGTWNPMGANFADWPVDYDGLEPFYTYCEYALGVQGLAGANPFEGPRSKPFPMAPGVPMYVALLLAAGATKLGYQPFPFPTAVNSQPYDGRPPCVDCGYCSGYGCPSNAKGSPAVTMLRKALLSGNCQLVTQTRAVKLLMSSSGNTVTGVQCLGPDAAPVTYSADRYVLAASPIEDARLLLLSDPGGDGVGNSSGQVGCNLMFHFQTNALGVFPQRVHGHRGRTVTHGFADFRGVPNDPDHPLAGIVELSGSEFLLDEANYYLQVMSVIGGFDGATLKNLMRQSPGRDRVAAMAIQAEDAPQVTNRVDLDPAITDLDGLPVPRITYSNHKFELSASAFYGPKLISIFGAAGCKYAALAPTSMPASDHIMGTLRFGPDPATSVCDPAGRFHDVGNLYVADGALFPTSSGFNPTMTIVTLATYVAAGMVFPGSPETAIAPTRVLGGVAASPAG
jgi:choline dehydrogenase-like flavoprotein